MAIYLDTNVMYGWRTFAELDRLALTILASELHQDIVVPRLVAEELEGHMQRELEGAAKEFETASSHVEWLFELDYVMTEPVLDPDLVVSRWRTAFEDAFDFCDVTADDARAGLRREIIGAPPARRPNARKPGVGGRDAAIWLAVVRDHASRGEPGHLITRDRGFWDGERMQPRLAEDIPDDAEPLTLHKDIERFLIRLGKHDDIEIDPNDVYERAFPLIKSGLERSPLLPRAVFDEDFDDLDFRTEVTDGTIERIERARRFVGNLGEILLIDATWKLSFRLLFQERLPEADSRWFVVDELDARGQVQVYLGQRGIATTGGQFIAAQLKPRQTVWRGEDRIVIASDDDD